MIVVIVWPGAAHAPIGVKLIPAKFHPHRSTFSENGAQKNLFSANNSARPCLWMGRSRQ